MAMNRLTRDNILLKGMALADIPSLDAHDQPTPGTITATAFSIDWLQEALDWFYQQVPMAGILTPVTVTIVASTGSFSLPSDFLLDMRDGIIVTSPEPRKRLIRTAGQEYVSRLTMRSSTSATQRPAYYVVLPTSIFCVGPSGQLPDQAYTGQLWYYALPAALASGTIPTMPGADLTLVEFIRMKAMEWARSLPPGSALEYAKARVAEIQKSGLFNEPESDTIPLDTRRFVGGYDTNSWDWMGPAITNP